MAIIFGSARVDEKGTYSGGAAGDQKQKNSNDYSGEVSMQNGYNHSKGWNVLRAKENSYAEKLSGAMITACNNSNIGYSQSDRYGVIKNGVTSKVKTNADCSSLVRACIIFAGMKDPGDFNTSNEKAKILSTGMFMEIPFTKLSDLQTGDILVTKTKGHTVIVTSGNKPTSETPTYTKLGNNPYGPVPIRLVTSKARATTKGIKSYECIGTSVRWVQWVLLRLGYPIGSSNVDGECGPVTVNSIINFQKKHDLDPDGIAGPKTYAVMKLYLG